MWTDNNPNNNSNNVDKDYVQPIVSSSNEHQVIATNDKLKKIPLKVVYLVFAVLVVFIVVIILFLALSKSTKVESSKSKLDKPNKPLTANFINSQKTNIDVWTGKGLTDNWSNPQNWSDGVPTNNSIIAFNATKGTYSSNNNLNNITLRNIVFQGGVKTGINNIDLTGNSVSLSDGLTDDVTSSTSVDIGLSFNLTANQDFNISGNLSIDPYDSLQLVNAVVNVSKYSLVINGFNSSNISINSLAGSGSVVVNLNDSSTLTINQASQDLSGPVHLNSGITTIANVNSLGSSTVYVSNGATLGIDSTGLSSSTLSNNITIDGDGVNGVGVLDIIGNYYQFTLLGKVTLTGDSEVGFSDDFGNSLSGTLSLVNPVVTNSNTLTGTTNTVRILNQ